MFEKLKKGYNKAKKNINEARARSKHMSVEEYKGLQEVKRRKERDETKRLELYKIEQKYKRKRQSARKRGGSGLLDSITDMGKNVLKNAESSGTSNFNAALTGGSPKKRRKKKHKKRKVTIYV